MYTCLLSPYFCGGPLWRSSHVDLRVIFRTQWSITHGIFLLICKESAQTILRGTEEKCGSSRVRTISGSRPPLLSRLSENSGDESMSDVAFDSLPCSPSSATPHSQKMDMLRECSSHIASLRVLKYCVIWLVLNTQYVVFSQSTSVWTINVFIS